MRTDTLPRLAVLGAEPAFADPLHVGAPNLGDRAAFFRRLEQVLDSGRLTNRGPCVREFEEKLRPLTGAEHVVALCNGTIALELGARALGLAGEVLVPAYTFVATAHALRWQGIEPVFCDVDPVTHQIDPADAARRITPATTGILAVHLWGRPAPHAELRALADRHGLRLMYDAAHALGATHAGRGIGSLGDLTVLSFHATKVLGTAEGGAIATRDPRLAERVRLMANFGFTGLDQVEALGINGKMSELSAAMGLASLDHLDGWIAANRRNREAWRVALAPLPGVTLLDEITSDARNHHYVVAVVEPECPLSRDHLLAVLRAENALARRYFFPGCHRMEPYRSTPPAGGWRLPVTETLAERVLVLPNGTRTTPADIALCGEILQRAVAGGPALAARIDAGAGGAS
ncbi:MAG TPA: aminotransferase class I/II-fold pyridoxal phosphate-dependent enzyme [Candidatus Krumholzibacteria bacterium]|nr:aminotransferase class I/II-fold pyridoxal phosphate-dependent enzyme [Candidatus Krumholzibacteria bacterium]